MIICEDCLVTRNFSSYVSQIFELRVMTQHCCLMIFYNVWITEYVSMKLEKFSRRTHTVSRFNLH